MDFYQDGPVLKNTFSSDATLQTWLKRHLPPDVYQQVHPHLLQVGELAVTDWLQWSRQAEAQPPQHVSFDPWGRRIDEIQMSDGWKKLEAAAATEGIVASAYERKFGEHSRVYQAALLYLFHASSAFVSCPLAMTDGAARAVELFGDSEMKKNAFQNLISRDPSRFWTSGQWMTERTGGSDVSMTSTIAEKAPAANGFDWKLSGVKWFTSATTSQMAMLLARPQGAEAGSRGLSLFYTELRGADSRLKNIEILRLKDKLGTKALPTAELKLNGTPARLVGGEGNGVKKISALFNITRVYNAICAIAHWRRALDLLQDYSLRRSAFGARLVDLPLHKATVEHLEREFQKCFELTFRVAHLLGKDECGTATEEEKTLLRALTPVVKLVTAKRCLEGVSEVIELFGGAGYIEDTGIPKILRDAQVFSIWEGTTNVLSLDLLRSMQRENAGEVLIAKVERDFSKLMTPDLVQGWKETKSTIESLTSCSPSECQVKSRGIAFSVADIYSRSWQLLR